MTKITNPFDAVVYLWDTQQNNPEFLAMTDKQKEILFNHFFRTKAKIKPTELDKKDIRSAIQYCNVREQMDKNPGKTIKVKLN